ncbi:hypothetical protein [Phreatobacter aquaticus]|nr:hypothetical protein [Phreatobacter aquaticus]
MKTKPMPGALKSGERLEDRYGHVAIRAVAGAIKPADQASRPVKRTGS